MEANHSFNTENEGEMFYIKQLHFLKKITVFLHKLLVY